MIVFAASGFSFIAGDLVIVLGLQRRYIFYAAAGLVVNVVLNVILIPPYGFMAAAWVSLVTEVVVIGLALHRCLTLIDLRLRFGRIIRILVTSGIGGLAALGAKEARLGARPDRRRVVRWPPLVAAVVVRPWTRAELRAVMRERRASALTVGTTSTRPARGRARPRACRAAADRCSTGSYEYSAGSWPPTTTSAALVTRWRSRIARMRRAWSRVVMYVRPDNERRVDHRLLEQHLRVGDRKQRRAVHRRRSRPCGRARSSTEAISRLASSSLGCGENGPLGSTMRFGSPSTGVWRTSSTWRLPMSTVVSPRLSGRRLNCLWNDGRRRSASTSTT